VSKMEQSESTPFDWKEFSQRTWVVVVSGLVFPPLGIFLSWRKTDWAPKSKWIATGLMGLLLLWRMGGSEKKEQLDPGNKTVAMAEVEKQSAEGSTAAEPLNQQPSASGSASGTKTWQTLSQGKVFTAKQIGQICEKSKEIKLGMSARQVGGVVGQPATQVMRFNEGETWDLHKWSSAADPDDRFVWVTIEDDKVICLSAKDGDGPRFELWSPETGRRPSVVLMRPKISLRERYNQGYQHGKSQGEQMRRNVKLYAKNGNEAFGEQKIRELEERYRGRIELGNDPRNAWSKDVIEETRGMFDGFRAGSRR
jgi:hypothetical protein